MAVLENNSEGSSVPREVVQNLEVDDDYNKYTPSADCNSSFPGWNIFRTKKLTKKRHESKARRTDRQDPYNVYCSDEDYPQASSRNSSVVHRSIPTMMMTINRTIQKMSLKDGTRIEDKAGGGGDDGGGGNSNVLVRRNSDSNVTNKLGQGHHEHVCDNDNVEKESDTGAAASSAIGDSAMSFDIETEGNQSTPQHQLVGQCSRNNNNGSSCNLAHSQGKRRRHRRKQQYKRMAVDVQNDKRSLQLKLPTSNSSEDSGIGKRKRNIVVSKNSKAADSVLRGNNIVLGATGGVTSLNCQASTSQQAASASQYLQQQQFWQFEPDNDAVMMEYDDLEAHKHTENPSENLFSPEEESGESEGQNESLSDHNQDADDEESDYYNNDSSTTSLSESSFTILNSSKKFIPVHSREIRSGRRRLKNNNFSSIENEELSKFLQNPGELVLKLRPSSEKERQDFKNIASLYSLSYEEGCDPEEQRMWSQFTKTVKTSTQQQQQRRNEIIKAASSERTPFSNFSEGTTLAPLFDKLVPGKEEGENSDDFIDEMQGNSNTNSVVRGGISLLINSKRIKKGC